MRQALANSRGFLAVLLVIAIYALLRLAAHDAGNLISGDFAANYTGARIVRDGQLDRLYDVTVQRTLERSLFERPPDDWFNLYVLPPFAAYAFLPFALLPFAVAAEIYFVLTILLLVLSFRLLWSLLDTVRARVRQSTALACTLVSAPAGLLLMGGQNTAIVMFLLVSGLVLLVRQKDVPAGVVLGLGVFKPQLFVLMPVVLVLHRRWRALAAWAGTAFALAALSVLAVGVRGMQSYLHLFTTDDYAADIASGRSWKMISLVAEIRYLGSGIDIPGNIALLLSILPLALTPIALWTVRGSLMQTFALAILLTMVFNPHIYYYDLLLVIVPAVILLAARPGSYVVRGVLVAAFVLSWLMYPLHGLFGDQGWPLILLSTHWLPIPMLILTVVLIREMRSTVVESPTQPSSQPAPSEVGSMVTTH